MFSFLLVASLIFPLLFSCSRCSSLLLSCSRCSSTVLAACLSQAVAPKKSSQNGELSAEDLKFLQKVVANSFFLLSLNKHVFSLLTDKHRFSARIHARLRTSRWRRRVAVSTRVSSWWQMAPTSGCESPPMATAARDAMVGAPWSRPLAGSVITKEQFWKAKRLLLGLCTKHFIPQSII